MPDLSPYPDDNRPPSVLVFVIIGAFVSACIVIGFGLVVFLGW